MQKLLSIFVYLILLIFLESAAEVTGVPASAPAELPEEPNYVALTFDDGPRRGTTARTGTWPLPVAGCRSAPEALPL